jgi:hypothetical protein
MLKMLAKVADIGLEHSTAVRAAFTKLNSLVGAK